MGNKSIYLSQLLTVRYNKCRNITRTTICLFRYFCIIIKKKTIFRLFSSVADRGNWLGNMSKFFVVCFCGLF